MDKEIFVHYPLYHSNTILLPPSTAQVIIRWRLAPLVALLQVHLLLAQTKPATISHENGCSRTPNVEGQGRVLTEIFVSLLREKLIDTLDSESPGAREEGLNNMFHNLEVLQSLTPYPFLLHVKDEEFLNFTRTRTAQPNDLLMKWDRIFPASQSSGQGNFLFGDFAFLYTHCVLEPSSFPPVICQTHCKSHLPCVSQIVAKVYIMTRNEVCSSIERENWKLSLRKFLPPTFGGCRCEPQTSDPTASSSNK